MTASRKSNTAFVVANALTNIFLDRKFLAGQSHGCGYPGVGCKCKFVKGI